MSMNVFDKCIPVYIYFFIIYLVVYGMYFSFIYLLSFICCSADELFSLWVLWSVTYFNKNITFKNKLWKNFFFFF